MNRIVLIMHHSLLGPSWENWEQPLAHSLALHTINPLKLKCHMCSTTETETTAMGWDSLTHVQRTAAEPDSGWHSGRLEFTANTDDKDSWLACFSRSASRADKSTRGVNVNIQVSESLCRSSEPQFTQQPTAKHTEQQSLSTSFLSSGLIRASASQDYVMWNVGFIKTISCFKSYYFNHIKNWSVVFA